VFLDKSAFDINIKQSRAWYTKGARAVTRPTTRANTTSILGAISALGLITIGIKNQDLVRKEAEGYISSFFYLIPPSLSFYLFFFIDLLPNSCQHLKAIY